VPNFEAATLKTGDLTNEGRGERHGPRSSDTCASWSHLVLYHGELVWLLQRIGLLENTATRGSPRSASGAGLSQIARSRGRGRVSSSSSQPQRFGTGKRFAASRFFARMPSAEW
jgi:hypothetical protein